MYICSWHRQHISPFYMHAIHQSVQHAAIEDIFKHLKERPSLTQWNHSVFSIYFSQSYNIKFHRGRLNFLFFKKNCNYVDYNCCHGN